MASQSSAAQPQLGKAPRPGAGPETGAAAFMIRQTKGVTAATMNVASSQKAIHENPFTARGRGRGGSSRYPASGSPASQTPASGAPRSMSPVIPTSRGARGPGAGFLKTCLATQKNMAARGRHSQMKGSGEPTVSEAPEALEPGGSFA